MSVALFVKDFHDVSADRDAESLSEVLMKVIQKYNPEANLICQTYDSASCMSGQRGGVRARVKVQCSHALFVHCYAHRLNLVLPQKNIKDAKMLFLPHWTVSTIFFSRSPKRTTLLTEADISVRIPEGLGYPVEL